MDFASKTNIERIKTVMKEKNSMFQVTSQAFNAFSQL